MLPYLFVISLASLLAFVCDKLRTVNNVLYFSASFLVVLILAVFAGCRDYDVGFDALYYGFNCFRDAVISESFAICLSINDNEALFLLTNYLVAIFTDNFHVALGAISFVTVAFFYYACMRCADKTPVTLVFFCIMCLTFANSMNLIRQHMAMGAVFVAYTFVCGRNGGRQFWFWTIVAFFFHKSSLIASLLIWFVNRNSFLPNDKKKRMLYFLAFGSIGGVALLGPILTLVAQLTGFYKYLAYVETAGNKAGWTKQVFSITWPACCMALSALIVWARKRKIVDVDTWYFALCYSILCISSSMLGLYSEAASRLAYYFYPMVVVSFFSLATNDKFSVPTRFCIAATSFLIFLLIFIKTFGQHLAYHSEILSINL